MKNYFSIFIIAFFIIACTQKQNGTFIQTIKNDTLVLEVKNRFAISTDFEVNLFMKTKTNDSTIFKGDMYFLTKTDTNTYRYNAEAPLRFEYNDKSDRFTIYENNRDYKGKYFLNRRK